MTGATLPKVHRGDTSQGDDDLEHIVTYDNPDVALCGVDQTNAPWDTDWPVCEACKAIATGRMN